MSDETLEEIAEQNDRYANIGERGAGGRKMRKLLVGLPIIQQVKPPKWRKQLKAIRTKRPVTLAK